jgi:hypothetical protein
VVARAEGERVADEKYCVAPREAVREVVAAAAKAAGCWHSFPRNRPGEAGPVLLWGEREPVRACVRALGLVTDLERAWGEELKTQTGVLAGSVCYRDARTGELLDRASATLSEWSMDRAGLVPCACCARAAG